MRLQDPVANVDDVDVLFDNDVAGENLVMHPIAQTDFLRRSVGPLWAVDVARKVVGFTADDFAEGAGMDAADHFDKRRTIADLKPDIEAQFTVHALANVNDLGRAGDIHRDGLFQIDVLAGGDGGVKLFAGEDRRRGDDDSV